MRVKDKYISPFTDFGFNKLFGSEPNKDLLIDFINELLRKDEGEITDLTYLSKEQLGRKIDDRKVIFDIYCENEKGKWDFHLKSVYTIGILDFVFDEDKNDREVYHHEVQLFDKRTQKVFYDKLTYVYLEMPKFVKTEDELETHFDKWLFILKNLEDLTKRPSKLQERVFGKLFEQAEIANYSDEEYAEYEESLKCYRDLKNSIDTAFSEGKEEGVLITAKNMKTKGYPAKDIAEITGLSIEEIEKL